MKSELFHNTIGLDSNDLGRATKDCRRQQDRILEFYLQHPGRMFTPFEIYRAVFSRDIPITSVRRAITNLTRQGRLIKTMQQKMEQYGKPNYYWRIAPSQEDLFH